jgi:exopolysaccharide production protein ExoZ
MSSISRGQAAGVPSTRQSIVGLQYLRGLAALMVVFHHARQYFPSDSILGGVGWNEWGSRGVDIFFVISGFVMVYSTQGYAAGLPRAAQAVDFLLKRAIRVVPLYWIATLWTAKWLILRGEAGLDLAKDFLFVPHFHDQGHGLIWPYLFQGWTINYEMFFYLLFALSMLIGRLRHVGLSLFLVLLTALGVVATFTHPEHNAAIVIFYTSNLLFEFLLGVWLSLWMSSHPIIRLPRAVLVGITVLGLALLAVPNPDTVRGFADGLIAVAIVWSTVLWAAGTKIDLLRKLGDASYSIYLFHLSIYGAVSWLFGSLGLVAPTPFNMVVAIALYLVLASVFGVAVHQLIEKPLLQRLHALTSRVPVAAPVPVGQNLTP